MNPVMTAMTVGYTADAILKFLMSEGPQYRKMIESAMKKGYTPDQVLDFINKEFTGKLPSKYAKELDRGIKDKASADDRQRIAELKDKRERTLEKTIGGLGLAAAGGMAARAALGGRAAASTLPALTAQNPPGAMPLPGAGPMPGMGGGPTTPPTGGMGGGGSGFLGNVMSRYAQHIARGGKMNLDNFIKAATQEAARGFTQSAGQGQAPAGAQEPIDVTQEAQWSGGLQPQAQAPVQQPAQAMQESAPTQQPIAQPEDQAGKAALQDTDTILEAMKLKPTIEAMLKAGNQPDVIADLVNFKLTPGQKAWVKEEGVDIPAIVKEYADKITPLLASEPKIGQSETQQPLIPQIETQPETGLGKAALQQDGMEAAESPVPYKAEPLSEGSFALLPSGELGTVTGIKGNRVDLDVDGQRKVAPTDHIVQTTYDPNDFMQSVAAYWDEMPEEEKSGPMWFNFYSPQSQTAMVGFLSDPETIGVYHGVPQETWNEFIAGTTPAKTTGKTGLGAQWEAGSPSKFGAALGKTLKTKNPDGSDKYPYEKVKITHNNMLKFLKGSKELKSTREKEEKAKEREAAGKALKSISEPPTKEAPPKKETKKRSLSYEQMGKLPKPEKKEVDFPKMGKKAGEVYEDTLMLLKEHGVYRVIHIPTGYTWFSSGKKDTSKSFLEALWKEGLFNHKLFRSDDVDAIKKSPLFVRLKTARDDFKNAELK